MLTASTSVVVEKVLRYFIETQSMEAYYSDGQEFNGFWNGKAAKMLGLSGRVDKEAFTRLSNNQDPVTGEQLTERLKAKRRVGTDFTFGVPKSVSLAFMFSKDERIVQALRQAVHDTVLEIEQAISTRVRDGYRNEDRLTKNLVGAEFVHLTSRPENQIPDPHLHVHFFVFNATLDPVSNKWKATQIADIIREIDYYNKVYLSRLAANLQKLGLEITPTEKSFEIAGVSRELVEKFSNRTLRIEEEARLRGITNNKEKAKLALLTREKKVKTLLISELEPIWRSRLTDSEKVVLEGIAAVLKQSRVRQATEQLARRETAIELATDGRGRTSDNLGQGKAIQGGRISLNRATKPLDRVEPVVEPTEHDRRAVALAIEHIFERASVVSEMQLIAEALSNWCIGRATLAGVKRVVAETPLLRVQRGNQLLVTTSEVLAEENRIVDKCLHGKWQFSEINRTWEITDERLNDQQRKAVKHVLNSRDWIVGISGKAGTGKTTLLSEAKKGIEAGGQKLLVLAPTSEAARDVLRKQGFENADTVAQLLRNKVMQHEYFGAVWWVDEAGLLSARQADKLLCLAEQCKARVVWVGDTGQHHSVERGQAFELLQKYGCLDVASVEEIKRQHGEYKKFVELVAAGKIQEAVDLLKELGWVYEMDRAERKMALARDYVSAIEAGKTAQVVAPTHKECDEVSESIRELLKEKGLLGKGTNWKTLRDLSWSDAQKCDPDHYQPGLVVQINDHVKGFALGEQIEIQKVDEKSVTGRDERGRKCKIPLSEPKSFGVYERGSIEVCKGENLRVTANGRTADRHRLYNGKSYKVDHIAPDGKIVLANGWRLDKDFKHLEYAYPETSHSIQGKTVDCVFVVQTAEFSSFASDQNQFYVSTSRGSDEMKLYTDTLELLVENVSEKRERLMATELINGVGQTVEAGIEEEDKISWQLGSLDEKMPPKALMEKIQRPDRKHKKKAPKSVEESIREPESASDILGTQTATQPEIIEEILEEIEDRRREKKQEPAMGLGM